MARALVQSKIAKELRTANGGASEDDGLPPGHMRLYSYYKPALGMRPLTEQRKKKKTLTVE